MKEQTVVFQVSMEFDQVPSFTDISPILLPEIPIKSLYIWSGYVEEDDWRICDLLTHISLHFNKTLGELVNVHVFALSLGICAADVNLSKEVLILTPFAIILMCMVWSCSLDYVVVAYYPSVFFPGYEEFDTVELFS